jgi:two-component system NarL family sensor kinase
MAVQAVDDLGTAPRGGGRVRAGTVVGLWLIAAAFCPLLGGLDTVRSGEPAWHAAVNALLMIVPATVGAALALRLPANPFGYLLLASTAAVAVGTVAGHWSEHHPTAAWAEWGAWLGAVCWAAGPPMLPLLALLFPDGRPVGRLGRWGIRATAGGVALVAAASALMPGRLEALSESPGPPNPLGVPGLRAAQPALLGCAVVLLLAAAVLAIVTLGQRWRRSPGERLALAAAGMPLVVGIALAAASNAAGLGGHVLAIGAILIATLGIPAGIWVAVTRYRLYDLDLAIARTLAYAVLASVLAGLFAITAGTAGLAVGRGSAATAAIAAAVTALASAPLRRRVLAIVQRAVLGVTGDVERAASIVERRLAAITDPDLLADLAEQVVGDVLGLPEVRVIPRGREPGTPWRSGCRCGTTTSRLGCWASGVR